MTGNCIHCQAQIEPHFKACPLCGEPISAFVRQSMEAPIDGKYQILSRLGRGGMGEVYKVLHVHLNTVRVIKLMHPAIAGDSEALDRFVREARLATKINHPNVATLHDFSTLPDGSFYMVWEYIEGKSLAQLIQQKGRVSPRYTALIAIQALHGLDAVHRAGIVHRDVSPDNIMLAVDEHGEERVKIIDLGIAKAATDAAGQKTQTGMFVGKWRYCSPEHLGMLPEGERIDGRADLYSFGIVLYEMLSGTPPFVADGPQQYYMQHMRETPKPIRMVNPSIENAPELERVIFRALEKDRGNRFATARDFADALQAVLPTLPDTAEQSSTVSLPLASTTQRLTPVPSAPTIRETRREEAAATVREEREPVPARVVVAPTLLDVAPRRSMAVPVAAAVALLLVAVVAVAFVMIGRRPSDETLQRAAVTEAAPAAVAPAQVLPGTPATVASTTIDVIQPPPAAVVPPVATERAEQPAEEPQEKAKAPVVKPAREKPRVAAVPLLEPMPAEVRKAPAPEEPPRVAKSGRRGGKGTFTDSPEYRDAAFVSGVIPDYEVLSKTRGVNWLWTAPGFKFASHRYKVGSFRNLTSYDSPELHAKLRGDMQGLLDEVTEEASGETITTENAIIWSETSRSKKRGVGVEMVFRDANGRIVAMLRHVERESSPEAAADEVVEAVVEYVEEH